MSRASTPFNELVWWQKPLAVIVTVIVVAVLLAFAGLVLYTAFVLGAEMVESLQEIRAQ